MNKLSVVAALIFGIAGLGIAERSNAAIDSQCKIFSQYNAFLGHLAFYSVDDTLVSPNVQVLSTFNVPALILPPGVFTFNQTGSSTAQAMPAPGMFFAGIALTQWVSPATVVGESALYLVVGGTRIDNSTDVCVGSM